MLLRREPRLVTNTAGEPEREARSRAANLLEALVVMMGLLIALWWVAYPFGTLLQLPAGNLGSGMLVAALLAFGTLVSPRWHADTLKSWGLGNPRELLHLLRRAPRGRQLAGAGLGGAAVGFLTLALYRHATGAARFILGVEPTTTLRLQNSLGGTAIVFVLCLGLAVLWATCIIRYDNFLSSLRAALKMLALLVPVTLLVGWAANGSQVFLQVRWRDLWQNGLGYIFWGAVQQLVFCSYFGTRLRKGFSPAQELQARPWKRLAVATLNGLFFGLVHMNSWLLVGFTSVLGAFLAWFFMEDRYRNLQALGLVHGVLGTCVIWLFTRQRAPVRLQLRVGPWGMTHHLDWPMLAIGSALICGFALASLSVARLGRQPRGQF